MNKDDFQESLFTSDQQKSHECLVKLSKQTNKIDKQVTSKPICTRCGATRLMDITQHEFPKQKGLLFECMSCGNNSLRSNVSDDERRRRLAMIAADHLSMTECRFCHRHFYSSNDYLLHLRNDHGSNKKT